MAGALSLLACAAPASVPVKVAQSPLDIITGKAFVLVRGGDIGRARLDLIGRVAHGDGQARHLEHRQIVLHVADGGDG